MLRYIVNRQSWLPPETTAPAADDHRTARPPAARPARTLAHWIPVAILLLTLGAVFLRGAEFPADGRGMDSAESAHSPSPIDDDSSPDPILAGADCPLARSGKSLNALPFGIVRTSSLAIPPPAPPPKN